MKNKSNNNQETKAMSYDALLATVPFNELCEWCHNNLTKKQRKKIGNNKPYIPTGGKRGGLNLDKAKKAYLFDLTGELIGEFDSIRSVGRHLGFNEGSVMSAYKRKRPLYKLYYITDSPVFDIV